MAASFDVPPVCYQVCIVYSLQHHPTLSHSLTGLHGLILSHRLTGLHGLILLHSLTLYHSLEV